MAIRAMALGHMRIKVSAGGVLNLRFGHRRIVKPILIIRFRVMVPRNCEAGLDYMHNTFLSKFTFLLLARLVIVSNEVCIFHIL